MISIEVAYALPDKQTIITLDVNENERVESAITLSHILEIHPEIDLSSQAVGIFGQIVSLDTPVEAGDRIEIYRPLILDPMEARRARAAKQKKLGRLNQKKPSGDVLQRADGSA